MLRLKLICISKRGPWRLTDIHDIFYLEQLSFVPEVFWSAGELYFQDDIHKDIEKYCIIVI